jgi:5-methylcytosine-specific restriction enzyme subunit McrC
VDDLFAHGETQSFSFLIDMNRLFERFVARLLEWLLPPDVFRITCQVPFNSVIWNVMSQRSYSRIVPDVMVEARQGARSRVTIDAKYKRYDDRRLDEADIYQTFLYAYALGTAEVGRLPVSFLLYPTSSVRSDEVRLRVKSLNAGGGAEIVAVGIPITKVLAEITSSPSERPRCQQLKELIEDAIGCTKTLI